MQSTFWVKTKNHVKMFNQDFWYMACDKCNKVSNSSYNEVYECIYCKSPQARVTPRATARVVLEDAFGSIAISAVGEPVENLLQCFAKNLMEKSIMGNEVQKVLFPDITQLADQPPNKLANTYQQTEDIQDHNSTKESVIMIRYKATYKFLDSF